MRVLGTGCRAPCEIVLIGTHPDGRPIGFCPEHDDCGLTPDWPDTPLWYSWEKWRERALLNEAYLLRLLSRRGAA